MSSMPAIRNAEEQIKAVNAVLKELGCGDKPTLLVLNKADRVSRSVLSASVAARIIRVPWPSARSSAQGLDELQDAVIEMLSADFADAPSRPTRATAKCCPIWRRHAEIYRQEFHDNRVAFDCHLPRHLLHHIQGPDVEVQFLDEPMRGNASEEAEE